MKKLFLLILIACYSITSSAQIQKTNQSELDSLKVQIETIFMEDQLFRRLYQDAEKKFGVDTDEMEYFWKVVEEQDARLEKEIIKILDSYGWLGISEIGRMANTAIWGVIQHGSIDSKKKYAPLMRASVLKNESQSSQYARLIDRMLVNAGEAQLYGSQTTLDKNGTAIFFEIKNPEYVNKRRAEIGLGKIETYADERGIVWNTSQK